MSKNTRKVLLLLSSVIALLLFGRAIIYAINQRSHTGVDEIWNMYYQGRDLEGKTVVIRGDAVFNPQPEYPFTELYLVSPDAPLEQREAPYGFWFGIGIADLTCQTTETSMTCQPFDPSKATVFELKGTLHLVQIGKRPVIWLMDVDFEHSRQLVDGMWQTIPLGEFDISMSSVTE
jgi:hypothetical protein